MNHGEMQGWDIARERVADFRREAAQTRWAAETTAPRAAHPASHVAIVFARAGLMVAGFIVQFLTMGRFHW